MLPLICGASIVSIQLGTFLLSNPWNAWYSTVTTVCSGSFWRQWLSSKLHPDWAQCSFLIQHFGFTPWKSWHMMSWDPKTRPGILLNNKPTSRMANCQLHFLDWCWGMPQDWCTLENWVEWGIVIWLVERAGYSCTKAGWQCQLVKKCCAHSNRIRQQWLLWDIPQLQAMQRHPSCWILFLSGALPSRNS